MSSQIQLPSFLLGCLLLLAVAVMATRSDNCWNNDVVKFSGGSIGIGGIIDQRSRVGRELKIAMEMAVHAHINGSRCSNLHLVLLLEDYSQGSSARAASAVMNLTRDKNMQAIIGTLTPEEATLVYELDIVNKDTPIISITPTAKSPSLLPPPFFQMSNDIATHMQCIAAIVNHFGWRQVTALYEHSSSFASDSGLVLQLSDSLKCVGSTVQNHLAFSISNPGASIEEELQKLKINSNRVFILIQSTLQFAILLFEKANKLGMMGKGYAWIISDDIASLLDSVDKSVISTMQGVIGFKTTFVETSESFKKFKLEFRRRYRVQYPQEDEYSNPSLFALRAYDAIFAVAKARAENSSNDLVVKILKSNFKGLSGTIGFKTGKLVRSPTFQIVNVIGKSYREIAMWSTKFGFSENLVGENDGNKKIASVNSEMGELGSINWPGGTLKVPRDWVLNYQEKPLRIGVPARGAFNQFVKVSYDQYQNKTSVTGFSIDVFEAVRKQLPYHLPYDFVPYYGLYDHMIALVNNKSLDAVVGDTCILVERYEYVTFSQPYIESSLVMIVKSKRESAKGKFLFLKAFKTEIWVLMAVISVLTLFVVWLNEHVEGNPDFSGSSVSQHLENMLWFSVTILSFAQRESIRSNLSRVVLATWLLVTVIVIAYFNAILTSVITVSRLQPSITDIEYLKSTNAPVGCNGIGFISKYLVNVLDFKQENVRGIDSVKDYPEAFKSGKIVAAFLTAPHARVFLAQYCDDYVIAGPSYKFSGLGFVFPKGSHLAEDVSKAIVKVTQTGEINQLEKKMLSFSNCSSSKDVSDDPSLGLESFSGLFIVSGGISGLAFSISIARLLERHWTILSRVRATIISCGRVARRVSPSSFLLISRICIECGFQFLRGSCTRNTTNQVTVAVDVEHQNSVNIELPQNQASYS